MATATEIGGFCHPRFERVRAEFERNFAERGDVGASVCVTLEGETVVDLWGGMARLDPPQPWRRDTIGLVFSCTKGAVSLCAHMLASRGVLDLNAAVSRYWPDFARAGKEAVTVRLLLNHQAGLPAIRRLLPEGAFCDWDYMVRVLEEEEPFWEPGTRHGYHGFTFGWLVGEVIRRASGKTVGAFFRDEVAGPLGLDFWIGLPEELEPRVAPMIKEGAAAPLDMSTIAGMCWTNDAGFTPPGSADSRAAHAAEIPAVNGITNARGLAGLYAPLACGGSLGGVHLVGADDLARMTTVASAASLDASLLAQTRFSLGFFKYGAGDPASLAEEAFGHGGLGGSLAFADPKARMSFGYTMNKMDTHERAQVLADAVYQSLGYRSKSSGAWM